MFVVSTLYESINFGLLYLDIDLDHKQNCFKGDIYSLNTSASVMQIQNSDLTYILNNARFKICRTWLHLSYGFSM